MRLVPIYVDCTKKGDYSDLLAKYKVQGYPTTIYADADGNPLREMDSRDPAAIVKDIDTVVGKVSPRPSIWQPSLSFAKEIAKKAKKPVAIYVVDPKADLAKTNARLMKELGDRKTKLLWVLESATMLKKYELETAPAVVVVDPKSGDVLARISVKEDDKPDVLNKALDDASKLLKK